MRLRQTGPLKIMCESPGGKLFPNKGCLSSTSSISAPLSTQKFRCGKLEQLSTGMHSGYSC